MGHNHSSPVERRERPTSNSDQDSALRGGSEKSQDGRAAGASGRLAEKESRALHALAATAADEPYAILTGLLSLAVELSGGGPHTSTAGVSLLETLPDGGEQFRWVALSGCLADHVGGTTPRDDSPCGVCLDRGGPVVMPRPDKRFVYFQDAGIEFTEGLIVPFVTTSNSAAPRGTMWVVSHPPLRRRFGEDDIRLMESLASFAASLYWRAFDRAVAECLMLAHRNLVSAMSQEIRTPLSSINGYIDLLALKTEGTLNEAQASYIGGIRRAQTFLLSIMEEIAEYSRVNAGSPPTRYSSFS